MKKKKRLSDFLDRIPFIHKSEYPVVYFNECDNDWGVRYSNHAYVELIGWCICVDCFYGVYKDITGLRVFSLSYHDKETEDYDLSKDKEHIVPSVPKVRNVSLREAGMIDYLNACDKNCIDCHIPHDILEAQIEQSKAVIDSVKDDFDIVAQMCNRYATKDDCHTDFHPFALLLSPKNKTYTDHFYYLFSPDYLYRIPQLFPFWYSTRNGNLKKVNYRSHMRGECHFYYQDIFDKRPDHYYARTRDAMVDIGCADWQKRVLYKALKETTPSREPVVATFDVRYSYYNDRPESFFVFSRYKNGRLHASRVIQPDDPNKILFISNENPINVARSFLSAYRSNDYKEGEFFIFNDNEDIRTLVSECEMYLLTSNL